ncbi:MAG TPA: alpha/beta hydrolase [Gemmatimonadales bacterium]|nr:alpha/beta hydrolase [Gemmatimonadales bacterium]
MNRAAVNGVELEYEVRGSGEPVVFINPGIFADWFVPLLDQPSLADRHQLVLYHRAGCAGSSRAAGPVTLAQHASHCRSLMRVLGIERAHIVGHSSSGNLALQLALDAPEVVHSLAILEPALYSVPGVETSRAFVAASAGLYRSGDKAGAIDMFLRGVAGPGYRVVLDQALPGAFEQHVADADTFFQQELPALRQWSFGRDDARRITQPVLAVVGARSLDFDPIWGERHQLLLDWLPNVEAFVLPVAAHLLQIENPQGMAEGLTAFFARHPIVKLESALGSGRGPA